MTLVIHDQMCVHTNENNVCLYHERLVYMERESSAIKRILRQTDRAALMKRVLSENRAICNMRYPKTASLIP